MTQEIGPAAALAGKLRLLALPLLIVTYLALSAAPALGAKAHAHKGTFGSFATPSGIAIDEASSNVLVSDTGFEAGVDIFGPAGGAPIGVAATHVEAPPPGSNGLNERLAIGLDNSLTSPSKGALYLKDAGNHAVAKYTLNPLSEEYEPAGLLSATPALSEVLGIAVDAKGNVFVGAYELPAIVEFSPSGTEIGRIALPSEGISSLAFDSAGDLFAASGGSVWRFPANGAGEIELNASPTQIRNDGNTGIAIDRSTDTLYVASDRRVAQYSIACTPVKGKCAPELEFGLGILGSTRGIAVNSVSGDIYVVDRTNEDVAVFDPAVVVVPDPVTKDTTQVTETSATLNGTINAAGGPNASCEFQYATKEDFGIEEFEGASTAPCTPAGPFTGTEKEAVSAAISGLSAETTYVFRLVASNENGSNFGEALSFATVGLPKILASSITDVGGGSATVKGLVDPNGGPGAAIAPTYWVEYVSAADFKASGYANAIKAPPAGKALGSGTESVEVTQQLSGLSLLSAYHYRIVVENEAGEEIGPDRLFSTLSEATPGLPDGRVFEQVTPVNKNGAAPSGGESEVQAASDGSGIAFTSHGGFPGGEGSQQYPSFLARRGADWSTRGLLPAASQGSVGVVNGWSEDLTQSYVAQASQKGDPIAFLVRNNATRALRAMATNGDEGVNTFNYVDTSADGSVVAFESRSPILPGDASGFEVRNTYVWDRESGELRLAGVLNDGQPPVEGSLAGSNQGRPTTGGENQFLNVHYTQAQNTLSADGSHIFFAGAVNHQLYVRLNPTKPQSALNGEEECTEAAMACTIKVSASQRTTPDPFGEKPASFMTATPNGSQVFFTSSGKLTDDATTGPADLGKDLYRYDVASGVLSDLTLDSEDFFGAEVQGVLGTSDDGSYVYFAANGVLADGATEGTCESIIWSSAGTGECNLYLWHNGVITFVAGQQMVDNYLTADSANWMSTSYDEQKSSRVTRDGKTLLFRSGLELTNYDNEKVPEFYRYSAEGGESICITCNPTGTAAANRPTLRSIHQTAGTSFFAGTLARNLSADGNRIFFDTAEKLVAEDTNGVRDVYEWEAKGTGSCQSEDQNGGCLYLISTGTSQEPSYFADASADGSNAFIFTDQSLVGQDKDQIVDIYDARIGGGIASQNPPPPPDPCEGEACRQGVPAAPASQSAGSASFSGPDNPKPARHTKKSKHKKSHKKAHKKQSKHKKSHASRKHG